MMMLALIAPILVAASVLLLFLGLIQRPNTEMQSRMELYSVGTVSAIEDHELRQPFGDRVLKPLIQRLMRLFSGILPHKRLDKLRFRVTQAGYPGGLSATDFVGIKGWSTLFMAALAGLYIFVADVRLTLFSILLTLVFVSVGFMLPDIWLSRRITRRQEELMNALPDALDMLTIAVEAGLSFDQGLGEIVARWDNELTRELRRVLYEIGIGKARREALDNLSTRTMVPDIQSFVTAINHAEELGASMSRVLAVQSVEMRVRRRQRAQEAANKVPIKMMFPMVFLIFPALFAVILGPGIPRMFKALGIDIGG
jgi:tight adherence protein C